MGTDKIKATNIIKPTQTRINRARNNFLHYKIIREPKKFKNWPRSVLITWTVHVIISQIHLVRQSL